MRCTKCDIYFYVKFEDKNLSDANIKFCPKCGKEIEHPKTSYGCLIVFLAFVGAVFFVLTFFKFYKDRNSESSEAEAVSMNYTTLADQWELEEDDEFEWDEI